MTAAVRRKESAGVLTPGQEHDRDMGSWCQRIRVVDLGRVG